MNFENLMRIKEAVESFPKTRFYSMLEGNKICIQNTETEDIFEIDYEEGADCKIKFNTENAKKVSSGKKKKTKLDDFNENTEVLKNGIKDVFTEDKENAILRLKDMILSLPFVETKDIQKDFEKKKEKKFDDFDGYKTDLSKKFAKKIKTYKEEETAFINTFNLFNENNELNKNEFVDLVEVKKAITESSEEYEKFKEAIFGFGDVKNQIKSILESDEACDAFIKNMDASKDIKLNVTKGLLKAQKYNENLNIKEASSKLVSILENNMFPVGGASNPTIINNASDNKFRPQFFRFQMGIFTPEDVKTMMNELNEVFSRVGEYNDEDMTFMNNTKMQLEYMYHSGQINDHLIMEMIDEFNKRFAKPKDNQYNDPNQQLAWKNGEQMKIGNAQGMAQ